MRELGEKMEKRGDGVEAHNGWRFSWKVGVVQLIRADRVGDKNGFLSLSAAKRRANPVQSIWWREVRTPPPCGKKGETGARVRFFIEGEKLQCFLSGQHQGQLARD